MKKHLTPEQEARLRRHFISLLSERLPARAATDPAFPIRTPPEFAQVALNLAVGPEWVFTLAQPVYKSLPINTLVRAVGYLRLMLREGAPACRELCAASQRVSMGTFPLPKTKV